MAGDLKKKSKRGSAAFRTGVISLVFLIVGFQVAVFVHRAAVVSIIAHRDSPDTVFVYRDAPVAGPDTVVSREAGASDAAEKSAVAERRESHSPQARQVYAQFAPRRCESFTFNPNTVSSEDLMRLGFSEKQAASIIRYRESGGKFRRPADFAKSYVVEDSVYRRLEKYIDIPLLDINKADSAAFESLPGIGPAFASRMVRYRNSLGGYSFKEQLLDVYNMDREKYDSFSDLIVCRQDDARPFGLWTLPADSLRRHPYVRTWDTAKAIVLFRENTPPEQRNAAALHDAGIIDGSTAAKLEKLSLY